MTALAIGHSDRFKAAIVGAGVIDLLSFQTSDIPSWLPGGKLLAQPWDDPGFYRGKTVLRAHLKARFTITVGRVQTYPQPTWRRWELHLIVETLG